MLASMTGFGRAFLVTPSGKWVVEIQSINRKHMELFVVMPKELSRFELEVRKWVSEASMRGQITVRVSFSPNATEMNEFLPSVEILQGLKTSWENVACSIGCDPKKVDLPFIMLHFPFQKKVDLVKDEDLKFLGQCVQAAIIDLKEMKMKEGKILAIDLETRLTVIEDITTEIGSLFSLADARMSEKLQEKIKDFVKREVEAENKMFLEREDDIQNKIFRAVAFFSEKMDITEEIIRLRSHFSQFREIFTVKNIFVGRKMDFLIQEIGREVNTIGSKSADAKISYLVVEMKSELEKMREQAQNIE